MRCVAELQIEPGETTADRAFTVETVNCLGACALGPVVVIDGTYHDNMTPAKLRVLLEDGQGSRSGVGRECLDLLDPGALASFRQESLRARHAWPVRVTLSSGTCGEASGSLSVLRALQDDLQKRGLADEVHVRVTGCQGFCQQEPLLIVEPLDVLYCRVTAEDVAEIVSESVVGGRVVERLCFADDVSGRTTRTPADLPFFAKQDRELIGRNRLVDPRDIGDYIASGGYSALAHVLTSMDPDAVIEEIEGLRPAGAGRRRLSDRAQVGAVPARAGRGTLRHLQRRRGRPGRLHGPRTARGKSPFDPRRA